MEDVEFLSRKLTEAWDEQTKMHNRIISLAEENEQLRAYNDRLLSLNEKLMTVWADQNEMLLEYITNPNPTDNDFQLSKTQN